MVAGKPKVCHVMGVRPHIVKFTPITDNDTIIWTGQHYSHEMFADLWEQMDLPKPKYHLNKDDMLEQLRLTLQKEKPDLVVVYGDTYSTLVGAVVADFLDIPIAHIEAGIRSVFTRSEEFVRRYVDMIADYNFCHSDEALKELSKDYYIGKAFKVGDVHYDEYIKHRKHSGMVLATFHRAEHVDNKKILKRIFDMLAKEGPVIMPCHPRTAKSIKRFKIKVPKNVSIVDPMRYKELQSYYTRVKKVITDSGGVTKEAFMAGCPVEPIGIDEWPEVFCWGDGTAKEQIKKILLKELSK